MVNYFYAKRGAESLRQFFLHKVLENMVQIRNLEEVGRGIQ